MFTSVQNLFLTGPERYVLWAAAAMLMAVGLRLAVWLGAKTKAATGPDKGEFDAAWRTAYVQMERGIDAGKRNQIDAAAADVDALMKRGGQPYLQLAFRLLALGSFLIKRGSITRSAHLLDLAEKYLRAGLDVSPPGREGRMHAEYTEAALHDVAKARRTLSAASPV